MQKANLMHTHIIPLNHQFHLVVDVVNGGVSRHRSGYKAPHAAMPTPPRKHYRTILPVGAKRLFKGWRA